MLEAIRYKLRMFGVPIDGPADVICDNKLVVTKSAIPTSMLNKNHNSICYHRVREAQAAGTIRIAWIDSDYNQYDIFTKTSITIEKHYGIARKIFGWGNKDILPFK